MTATADVVLNAPDGSPCTAARTTGDLEDALGMRGGAVSGTGAHNAGTAALEILRRR